MISQVKSARTPHAEDRMFLQNQGDLVTRYLAILFIAFFSIAQISNAQSTQPTTNPATQALLDQVRDAYANLKSLELAGTFTFDADMAEMKRKDTSSFTASFQSPSKFR